MSRKPGIRPSELVLLAVHNLQREYGASERDIVMFIALKLNRKPEDIRGRVKSALTRTVALQLVSFANGKFRMSEASVEQKKYGNYGSVKHLKSVRQKFRPSNKTERISRKSGHRKNRIWSRGGPINSNDNKQLRSMDRSRRCECCGRKRRKRTVQVGCADGELLRISDSHKTSKSLPRWWQLGRSSCPLFSLSKVY
ncbi:hypothetical protein RUM44_001415 [Polyplax serrata]|uniref:H15 domain-containing protein n=1 Tax=Polyplax serrata TaxID=468196 RepID=A0ABR1AJZ7_POLSC